MYGDKAPGLNGFNMKFMQKFWYVIKDDVMEMFKELHKSRKCVRTLNSTFVTLIPKKEAKEFGDFRPISLVGCIYKLIAKVLAKRLSKVLGDITSSSQNAFVEGRQILNTVMATNEIVDDLVTNRKEGIICKLDMKKAYDHASWSFVDYMLKGLCLGQNGDFGCIHA